jgi:hypothetical protein
MRHYLVSGEHYTFGWMMFAVAMAIYFLIVRRWVAEETATPLPSAPTAPIGPLGVALALATLAVPGIWVRLDTNRATAENAANDVLPSEVAGWRAIAARVEPRPADFIDADGFEVRAFIGQGDADQEPVEAYRAFYLYQEQGREVAGYSNRPQGPDLQVRSNVVAPGERWREIKARYAGDEWLVWYVYSVGASRDVDALRAQLRYGIDSLSGNPVSGAWVLRTRCVPDCPAARGRLARFARDSRMEPQ